MTAGERVQLMDEYGLTEETLSRWAALTDRNGSKGQVAYLLLALSAAERAAAERMKARCVQEAEDAPLCCECGRGYLDCIAAIKALPLEEPTP